MRIICEDFNDVFNIYLKIGNQDLFPNFLDVKNIIKIK